MIKKSKANKPHEKLQQSLKHCLKDFKNDSSPWTEDTVFNEKSINIPSEQSPPPYMVFLTLVRLLGFDYWGKEEKVAWIIPIFFKGVPFLLSHRKFGFRVHTHPKISPKPELTEEMITQLNKGIRIADGLLEPRFQEQIKEGHVTVRNAYITLSQMYDFFRTQAKQAYHKKPPKPKVLEKNKNEISTAIQYFTMEHQIEGFYYSVAMIDAFFSRLEHLLVFVLPFIGFNTKNESLSELISMQWKDKFKRVFDLDKDNVARSHYEKLCGIKEKYRNTISHGFFQKDNASLLIHMEVVGTIPLYFSSFEDDFHFSMLPISEITNQKICDMFDSFEEFLLVSPIRYGLRYAESGLDIAFDPVSIAKYGTACKSDDDFKNLIEHQCYLADMYANMDW